MQLTFHLVITDSNGEVVIGIKEPIKRKTPSESLERLLNEPYVIKRLIKDAEYVLELENEGINARKILKPEVKYEWNGK